MDAFKLGSDFGASGVPSMKSTTSGAIRSPKKPIERRVLRKSGNPPSKMAENIHQMTNAFKCRDPLKVHTSLPFAKPKSLLVSTMLKLPKAQSESTGLAVGNLSIQICRHLEIEEFRWF